MNLQFLQTIKTEKHVYGQREIQNPDFYEV